MSPNPSAAHRLAAAMPEPLLARFARQRLPAGFLVSAPRAKPDRILMLREGRIRVFVANEDKELTLAYLAPGELFSTHTGAYLRCERECELLSMPTAEFARTMANEPGMLGLIMPVLGRILDQSIALIEDLAFRDVAGRLARFLLVAARQGSRVPQGVQVTLDLSAGEIAQLLGATRQTVSSLLKRMEREGLISRPARHQLVILQPEVLRRWQEGEAAEAA